MCFIFFILIFLCNGIHVGIRGVKDALCVLMIHRACGQPQIREIKYIYIYIYTFNFYPDYREICLRSKIQTVSLQFILVQWAGATPGVQRGQSSLNVYVQFSVDL